MKRHSSFVHLHNHSHYSLLDGAVKIEHMVEAARKASMPALAITDHGNLFGAVEFYLKASGGGVKPIVGCEMYVARESRFKRREDGRRSDGSHHLVLLARDRRGYQNLMKLSSLGYLEGFYYRPRVDKELLTECGDGLIGLSACLKGEIPSLVLAGRMDDACRVAEWYRDLFGKDGFYLELQDHGMEADKDAVRGILEVRRRTGIPVVATNDCHYLKQEHARAQDILLCIQTGKDLDQEGRLHFSTDQFYFKSPREMEELFAEVPEAIRNTVEVAEKCNLELEMGKFLLPDFPLPEGWDSADAYMESLARRGLQERYGEMSPEIEERFEAEVAMIGRMGFASYFLIIRDLIEAARERGIPVGPGRGSAAGCLVAYCLRITDLDPLKYGLLFERFLNPERIGMPDIDIDFCFERRGEVIDYAVRKYGQDNVCQIITFGTMAARAAIRDVGRVLGMPYSEVDRIAKLVPAELGITLEGALGKARDLAELVQSDPRVKELIEQAKTLEGLARHASTHAAGVLITPGPLVDYVPLYKSSKGEITTQYDMKSVEKIGLLKMDVLGLRTLTVIENTLKMVTEHQGVDLQSSDIPLDDPKVFDTLSKGTTVAVFQLESGGMRDLLRRLKPTEFVDIVAVNALHRPGPLSSGMVDDFIARKHGRKSIEYLHPVLEPILKETYGVILYQEQVMRIASEMGGFSLGQADILRRAMGKKDHELMARQRELFHEGSAQRKISKPVADRIFELMADFAGYGFNKSHSAAYALLSLQTAYLKSHFPGEFMAATLSSEMGNSDRVLVLIEECKRMGIAVLPPDVNESEERFTVVSEGIRFGLSAVKNVGSAAAGAIVEARKREGGFRSLRNLTTVTDLRGINRRMLESLAMAGGMDSLGGHRAQMLAEVPRALEAGARIQRDRERGQSSLFGEAEVEISAEALPDVEPWNSETEMRNEREALGFYLSRHPLDGYREQIETCSTATVSSLGNLGDGASVRLGGILTNVKSTLDRKGNPIAFATLEDFTGSVELLIFADPYGKYQKLVEPESAVLVTGRVSFRENEEPKVIVTRAIPLSGALDKMPATVHLRIEADRLGDQFITDLGHLADRHPGKSRIRFHLVAEDRSEVEMDARNRQVAPGRDLLDALCGLVGEDNAWVERCSVEKWN